MLGGSTGGSSSMAPVKIMAMGHSNTYGMHGYSNKEASGYRLHLDHKLQAEGLSFDMVGTLRNGHSGFDRDHEGYNGIQSDGLKAKIPAIMHANKPDVILLMRSEEHTSELQSLMRISYAVFCLNKKNTSCTC